MPCEKCRYYDENERWGSKGYCTYYKSYVYPDDRTCNHYQEISGGCFFTSACCEHFGKPDNCYELTVLRNYRDTYMKALPYGVELIQEYYHIAPTIIEKINNSNNTSDEYENIYHTIEKCISFIEAAENDKALNEYKNMILYYKNKYIN